jgi:hypothetical protein
MLACDEQVDVEGVRFGGRDWPAMRRRSGERRTETMVHQAVQTGENNKRIIALAEAYCRHINVDRSFMGVGEVEVMTGLPISGGGFRCDHSRGSTMTGMNLEYIALDFYRRNCRECKERATTSVLPNLGTWAEEQLRVEQVRRDEEAQRKTEEESAALERSRQRHLVAGTSDAMTQSVLGLVDKIDTPDGDPEAAKDLLDLADLHPEAFGDDLLALLVADALLTHRSPYMDAVVRVHETAGRPDAKTLVPKALECLSVGVSASACGRVLAVAASSDDILSSHAAFREMVALAGQNDEGPFHRGNKSEPACLFRAFELAPRRAEQWLSEELACAETYRMASACRASKVVIEHEPGFGLALLPALITATRHSAFDDTEECWESPQGAATAALGRAILHHPSEVEIAVDAVWLQCEPDERSRLLNAHRDALWAAKEHQLTSSCATSVAKRALACLLSEEDFSIVREAGEILSLVCGRWPTLVETPVESLFGAVALLAGDSPRKPSILSPLDQIDEMTRRQTIYSARSSVRAAAVGLGRVRSSEFWDCLHRAWEAEGSPDDLKACLVEMAGMLSEADSEQLPEALPVMYSAMLGSETIVRAAGFKALADAARLDAEYPEEVRAAVIVGLQDRYLIVVLAAVDAASRLRFVEAETLAVATSLLNFVVAYAPERMYSSTVRDAVWCLLRFAQDTEYEDRVKGMLLKATMQMPAYEATRLLATCPALRTSADWAGAVVRALRLDDDPSYWDLGDDERDKILGQLAECSPTTLAPHVDGLTSIGKARLPRDRQWAWQVAACLTSAGQFDAASHLAGAVLDTIPDTHEMHGQRLLALQVTACFELEAATGRQDNDATHAMDEMWAEAESDAAIDAERNRDARVPFL